MSGLEDPLSHFKIQLMRYH